MSRPPGLQPQTLHYAISGVGESFCGNDQLPNTELEDAGGTVNYLGTFTFIWQS